MQPLREIRLRKFLTIRDLAASARVATKTIVDIEAGRTFPRQITMRRIAMALDVEPSEVTEFVAAVDEAIEEGKDAA